MKPIPEGWLPVKGTWRLRRLLIDLEAEWDGVTYWIAPEKLPRFEAALKGERR